MRYIFLLLATLTLLSSCKSEFERLRTGGNPKEMYKAALKYYDDEDYGRAQTLFELSIPNYRGKEEAEELFFKYAYTYFHTGEYILASHYFKSFANTFYNSDKKEDASYLASYSNYLLSPNPKLDQSYTQKAIDGFQTFVNTYPKSPRVEEANTLIDEMRKKQEEKAFLQGQLYYKIGQYRAAVKALDNVLKDFPDSDRVEETRFLMLKASYLLATKSVYSKKKERYTDTIHLYENLTEKYRGSKYAAEAKKIYVNAKKELKNIKV